MGWTKNNPYREIGPIPMGPTILAGIPSPFPVIECSSAVPFHTSFIQSRIVSYCPILVIVFAIFS